MPNKLFYVYEHWRPDRDECFYVGKGHGGRANQMKPRNAHHIAIQAKLARLGSCVEVRIVSDGLTESEAFALEVERIAFWRADGADLANMTDGGEGFTGGRHGQKTKLQMSSKRKGHITSCSTKRKIKEKLKGRRFSSDTLAKMSLAQKKRASDPKKRAVLLNSLAKAAENNQTPESREKRASKLKGRLRTAETRKKISESQKGKVISAEARKKMSAAKIGVKQSSETVAKRLATIKRNKDFAK